MLFCVLFMRVYVLVIQQQYVSHKYEYQLVLFLTCPYYSRTPKNIVGVFVLYLLFYGMVYT